MAQHTHGPWSCDMGHIVATDRSGRHTDVYIAEIASEDDEGRIVSDPEQQANARLIAAAPDMLAVLLACVEPTEPGEDCCLPAELYSQVCAAIAKAEGRS